LRRPAGRAATPAAWRVEIALHASASHETVRTAARKERACPRRRRQP
jgi:hypothetical protein